MSDRFASKPAQRLLRAACLLALAVAVQVAAPAARGQPPAPAVDDPDASATAPSRGWVVGRTPAVFRDPQARVATRIGGWADASYQDNDHDGASLNLNHLNLFADTRGGAWQGFLEVEYENESDRSGFETEREFEIEQAYLRYAPVELLGVRAGRFNTPFGYWMPLHWSILMDTIEEPLFVGRELVPEQQIGVEAAGHWFPDALRGQGGELAYSLYLGHGSDALDQDDVQGLSGGGDLRLRLDGRHLIGVSLYRQRNAERDDRTERDLMLYAETRLLERLTLGSEWLHQRRERKAGSGAERDVDVLYARLRWDFLERAYLHYRWGWGDDEWEDDPSRLGRAHVHTFTLGVQPHARVRLKAEYSRHGFRDSDREDFDFWGLSVGVLF